LPVPVASPISSSIQNAGDHASPAFNADLRIGVTLGPGRRNLNSLRDLLIVQQHEVTPMKLIILAVATVLALSAAAFAQSSTETLGKSMRGVNNGVPYPNTNVTGATAPVGSGGWRHRWHHRHHPWHHRHHRH
jgi:hypothetical protein